LTTEPEHERSGAAVDPSYAARLQRKQLVRWKQIVPVQLPYRWNVRRLAPGSVLDVGCGIGRNLDHLAPRAVGVDTNGHSISIARRRGFRAYTPHEFEGSDDARPASYDSLLAAHLVEHLPADEAVDVLAGYVPYLKPAAKLVLITPQEAGYRSDPTHIHFADFTYLDHLAASLGFIVERSFSFPLPRPAGRVFKYNEFITVARRIAVPGGGHGH
jgi:2-polyprenyl-3-methyl-5-hydroxy-6-metoxy-1,4-benzoquinol methylase